MSGAPFFTIDKGHGDKRAGHGLCRITKLIKAFTLEVILLDGVPAEIAAILTVAREKRDDKQKSALLDYYRGADGNLKKLQRALADARKRRPVDPKLKGLRDRLAEASRALPIDPTLSRLRQDVELSEKQLKNQRLTGAQDITWALINSPAFLFNR